MSDRPLIGYYTCSCHNFATEAEWKKAYNQKLTIGDKVKHRCKGIEGEIFRVCPERGFVIVRYGKFESDKHLEHVEQLIKL
jgi:heat shock protein HspQ